MENKYIKIAPCSVAIGSDFKVKICSFTDRNGVELTAKDICFDIIWEDAGGRKYNTMWNPDGKSENVVLSDGDLYLIFDSSKYSFYYPGFLSYVIHIMYEDVAFTENCFDYYSELQVAGIKLV